MNPPDQSTPTLAPTPRTDAAKEQYLTGKIGVFEVLNEARTLERELTAERERVRVLRESLWSLAYWSRNHTETRITLRNRIASALVATEESK